MKIVFLDVDGVLNSYRNVVAQGGFPFPKGSSAAKNPQHSDENLDVLAVGMVRELCLRNEAQIVMHSTWRKHIDLAEFAKRWDLPILDKTDHGDKSQSVGRWLKEHPEVEKYVILDDDDMHDRTHQVFTSLFEGFMYKDFMFAMKLLGDAE